MATKIHGKKFAIRETAAEYRRRPLVVRLEAHRLLIWMKRSRLEHYEIDYQSVYEAAVKLKVLKEEQREGKASRKRRRRR